MDDIDRAQIEQERLLDAIINAARQSAVYEEGAISCDECGEEIPKARREALSGCRYCIDCQSLLEQRNR